MKDVLVDKEKLTEILTANREQHRAVVEDAWKGFRVEAVIVLDERLEAARKGLRQSLYVHLEMPEDHTDDYDRALGMLQMDERDQVLLTQQEYAQLVDDDWGWKRQWTNTNANYSAMVSNA